MDDGVWRGKVDAMIDEHERRLAVLNGNIAAGAQALNDLRVEVAKIGTKVGVGAGLAGGCMSVITGLIVFFLTQ